MFLKTAGRSLSFPELVLFPFDDYAIPFQHGVRLQLNGFRQSVDAPSNVVIPLGPPGSPDSRIATYYGTVHRIGDELWMWYLGQGDQDQRWHQRVCLATSRDGRHWEKPSLGLVDYGGSRANNLVDLMGGRNHITACLVFHEPDDPDPQRRFKMVFHEWDVYKHHLAVAFSRDGLRWHESPHNPVGPRFEPMGGVKRSGAYCVNGQGGRHWSPLGAGRRLVTHTSYDFEHWTEATCLGLRRDAVPPRAATAGRNAGSQIHLGATLWDRGNVLVGFYGMWNGHPSNDRRLVWMDLGLVASEDGLHFREPVPDFPIVEAMEIGWKLAPHGDAVVHFPALIQGQGFENIGEETLFWYSPWPEGDSDGIRLATWPRDRLGHFQPFVHGEERAHVITAPIDLEGRPVRLSLNVDGITEHSRLVVRVLDEQFRPVPGYGAEDMVTPITAGFAQPVRWRDRATLDMRDPARLRIDFEGLRPEDVHLHAVYLAAA